MTDPGRPQDQGRRHRARGRTSTETDALLDLYRAAMRTELRAVLVDLEGTPAAPGLIPDVAPARVRPSLADRSRLWDLAIKLGRELGTGIDADPTPQDAPGRPGVPRRGRVDFG